MASGLWLSTVSCTFLAASTSLLLSSPSGFVFPATVLSHDLVALASWPQHPELLMWSYALSAEEYILPAVQDLWHL